MALVQSNGHSRKQRSHNVTIAAFGIGLVIGVLVGGIWLWLTPPAVPLEDYAVLVSAAYQRERLPLNATERLAAAGVRDVPSTVATIARDYLRTHPDRQGDAKNLQQLAEALGGQAASSGGTKAADHGGWWEWLLGAVLLVAVIAALPVLWQTRRRKGSTIRAMPEAEAPKLQKAQLVGGLRSTLPPQDHGGVPPRPVTEPHERGAAPTRSRETRLSTVAGRRRELVLRPFVCSYHAGEEPFEDVHPILHEDGDTLVGACGLTGAAKMEAGSPARYYAFTAWVHDYLSGEPVCAVGLLSPWASGRKRLSLYDPTLTRATLQRATKGLLATMETRNLLVTVEVADLGFGTAHDVPANSYFTILSVKFAVTIKS